MIAMQYKIALSDDFNMDEIRQRVFVNGEKTDGFQDLLFKAYLISENSGNEKGNNEYSPLYLWKDSGGMNTFIFEGFYDNILHSFGWQTINIGIPMTYDVGENFRLSNYVLEVEHTIANTTKMKPLDFSLNLEGYLGRVLIYHPDKWLYSEYYFYENRPQVNALGKIYTLLHLSQ